jgi:hypothetical protein
MTSTLEQSAAELAGHGSGRDEPIGNIKAQSHRDRDAGEIRQVLAQAPEA